MNERPSSDKAGSPTSRAWIGPVCGIASAVLYTLTNIALRRCVDVDAYLVSSVKAAPTVLVLGPLLALAPLSRRRTSAATKRAPPSTTTTFPLAFTKQLARFIFASFLAQFFGNAAFQKALEYIGLAASVPITLGVLIVGGAILGAVILKEPVGTRKVVAMITLIGAVIVLSLPSGGGTPSPDAAESADTVADPATLENAVSADQPPSPTPLRIVIGSLWAALSGLAYSFFGVTMRQTLQSGMPPKTLMFLSGLTGLITLGSYCAIALGYDEIAKTTSTQWITMFTAGFCNFSAFIAITAALRSLPVVAVNLLNASQVAMAAVAGVLLFDEEVTAQLAIGIVMTFIGLVILAKRTRAPIVITD